MVDRWRGFTEDRIKDHVSRLLGKHYALTGVASLARVGLEDFPVNATHKIIKPDVERAARLYAQNKAILHIGAVVSVAMSIPLIVLRLIILFWQLVFSLPARFLIPRTLGLSLVDSSAYEKV